MLDEAKKESFRVQSFTKAHIAVRLRGKCHLEVRFGLATLLVMFLDVLQLHPGNSRSLSLTAMTNQKTPMKLWLSPLSGPLILVALQILIASFALSSFIFGTAFLAFSDIGGDSFTQMIPAFTHLARELQSGWPSAWTFHYGLGNANSGIPNPFWLVGSAWGPDGVLRSLIWAYLSRLILAGLAFYWLLHLIGYRRTTCIVMALSYSYCGYATVDGQWDSMLSGLVLYPLVLVGTELYLRRGNIWALPLMIALAAYGGVFMFAVGLFLVYACIWRCLLADSFV